VSESLAKMCLQQHVTEEHVQEALRLFEVSTIDAARSGVAEMVVLTPEQREELTRVETMIKCVSASDLTFFFRAFGTARCNAWQCLPPITCPRD
jgi:DNA replicative helicase MCM subunit Mcm2 (Cdc46/Mcm family)